MESLFVTGPLTLRVGRDGGGDGTDEILDSSLCPILMAKANPSKEMRNFIAALRKPLCKDTGLPIKDLQYALDINTYKEIFTKEN